MMTLPKNLLQLIVVCSKNRLNIIGAFKLLSLLAVSVINWLDLNMGLN